MGGFPNPELFNEFSRDYWVSYAMLEIESTFGVQCSDVYKKKSLRKFGRTTNADNGVKTTVGTYQGTEVNETFATSNSIDSIVSSSASDTDNATVSGHINGLLCSIPER